MKSKIFSAAVCVSLFATLANAELTKAEKNLVKALKASNVLTNNGRALINYKEVDTNNRVKKFGLVSKTNIKKSKKIKSKNSNYARVMIRLKPGVDPQKAYKSIIKTKGVNNDDIKLVKSFGLAGGKKAVGIFKKQKQSIIVIESNKLGAKKLIDIAKKIDGVDIVEESKKVYINTTNTLPQIIPNDPYFSDMWGMHNDGNNNGISETIDADIDAPEAWVKHKGYSSVVVGDIDTGIDYYHPDLKDNIWVNEAEVNGQRGVDDDGNGYVDDYYGIDTANGDSDPYDDNAHGTHTAGTIGAAGNNQEGVVGVNWHVKIAACKFLTSNGWGYIDGAVECVNYFNALKDAGVNIVATNNSWGGGGYSEILHDAISAANDRNINFIAAAGNDGNDNDENPSYPASYDLPNVISVAASDSNDELTSWSNYGATSVDLAAPGDFIVSTYPSYKICTPNDDHIYFSDGFENGIGKWDMLTVNPSAPFKDYPEDHWQLDNSMAANGNYSLSDSKDGNYTNSRYQTALMKNGADLSSVNTTQGICATLKIKGTTEEGVDGFHVLATNDDGETWYYLGGTWSSYDDWTDLSVAIPTYLYTKNLKIALVKANDYSITYDGYNIDDFKITSGTIKAIGQYAFFSGTSMATPHVTGAIAYISRANDNQTAVERKNRILNAVDHIAALDGKVATGGRLNLAKLAYDMNLTKGDFNKDKIADIVWRKNTGKTNLWIMDENGTHTILSLGTVSTHYKIAAIGDGTGDGIADILWRKDTGKLVGWKMNSDGSHNAKTLGTVSTHWSIKGFDDIDGNGLADILWRKDDGKVYLWFMKPKGTHKGMLIGSVPTSYSIKSLSDLNGDGLADILWRKDSGKTSIWYMDANGTHTSKNLGNISTQYTISSVSDLNGDGISDIIWRRDDGKTNIWYMSADGTHTTKSLGTISTSWTIVK